MVRDIMSQAYEAMRFNRRRTALTMLGMAWGIATVVLLLAYGNGFGRAIETIFAQWGTRIIGVFPGRTSQQAAAHLRRAGLRQMRFPPHGAHTHADLIVTQQIDHARPDDERDRERRHRRHDSAQREVLEYMEARVPTRQIFRQIEQHGGVNSPWSEGSEPRRSLPARSAPARR